MTPLGSVPYFLTIFATYQSNTQDPWTIESPMLKTGSVVSFHNTSTVGLSESLSWTWLGLYGEIWENKIWYTYDKEIMGGSFVYKKRAKSTKDVVTLYWERLKNGTVWYHDKQLIKQPEWKISVRGIVDVSFVPLDRDWVFAVDEEYTYGMKEHQPSEPHDVDGLTRRLKRSPQSESDSADPGIAEASFFGDWIERIMNFFFGDGSDGNSRTTGQENEGIFTRLGNWLRGISCSLHGPCDMPVPGDPPLAPFPQVPVVYHIPPQATYPPATTSAPVDRPPTMNPDAEPVPDVNIV
ncbi:Hypothetical protein NTJ_07201 [Nesidiocoris tenuis]|uniref:Uncharacterized protein n=1 Tax=Nesidiocoris tenuis TaxID=355587 RepID=A0ABN7AQA8_9HEMI|nr:Hypothetical protein NTJ_07201 [Nesidiocoris tenuis]